MQLKPGSYCPLLKKECVKLQCAWFIMVRGTETNTGKAVDEWGCSVAWLPHMMLETANQTRQAGAATESFRNEFVKSSENTVRVMAALAGQNTTGEHPMKLLYDDSEKKE